MQEPQIIVHIPVGEKLAFDSIDTFQAYIDNLRFEGKGWRSYDHLPLLKIIADDTGEEFLFKDLSTFPLGGIPNLIEISTESFKPGQKGATLSRVLKVQDKKEKGGSKEAKSKKAA